MKINLLDLFSGIGGFAKGLEQAGFEIENHYFSEIDKHAVANYRYNFPGAEYVGSVVDVRGEQFSERINAITFGSPCQDFSLAGKRKGMEGERSSLIGEAIRLIRELRPDFFIWENVKGVYSSNAGADFWGIIQAFANIGGYRLEWQLLNTAWFLPQNRERVYLVGRLADQCAGEVFPITEKPQRTIERSEQAAVARCLTGGGNSGGMHSSMTLVAESLIKVKSATKAGYELAGGGDSINLAVPNSETRRGKVGKGMANTLDTNCNQGVVIGAIRGRNPDNPKSRKSGLPTEQMLEINENPKIANVLSTVQKDNVVIKEHNIRRLTEVECERLQGFPDTWTSKGIYDGVEKDISATQRYKMLGNAVTVNVVQAVGQSILNKEAIK